MVFKDILAIVESKATDEHVLAAAEQLATQTGGCVSGLVVGWLPPVIATAEGWVASSIWGDYAQESRKQLASDLLQVKARIDGTGVGGIVASEILEASMGRTMTAMRARHADISVVGRPRTDASQAILEGPLFGSGRPVLVVPPVWKPRPIGKSVVVGWKPTREAARALGDACNLLQTASAVTVVTVDAEPSEDGYGPQPGGDISAHLARRGCSVKLANLDALGRSEALAIQEQALAIGADLIVMGAYGRSRLSEFIFGGMTREMLKTSPLPVLMSH